MWNLQGFVHTAFYVDEYLQRILGWRAMSTRATPLVTSVLEQAVYTRRRTDFHFTTTGLVHHYDAGSQYTSPAFTDALRDSRIAGSTGSVGDALDNALMESITKRAASCRYFAVYDFLFAPVQVPSFPAQPQPDLPNGVNLIRDTA